MATFTGLTPITKIASFMTSAIGNVGQSLQSGEVEYYWVRKRFKYRPPGEAYLYD